MKFLLGCFFSCLFYSGFCTAQKTEINICSTIHGAHKINPNYSYGNLFAFIDAYDADMIGVEIRPEDIDSTSTYLSEYYPYEMVESTKRYTNKKIYGFDWLGAEIEGQPIPDNYFKELNIKKLETQLAADSLMVKPLMVLDSTANIKKSLAIQASLQELNSGSYDRANVIYYDLLSTIFKDTPYSELLKFYAKRDAEIAKNIIDIIKANKGKKILILMGADHRSHANKAVEEVFGQTVQLNTLFK